MIKMSVGTTNFFEFSIIKNGESVARAYLNLVQNSEKKPYGLLEDVWVADKARKQGLGTEIVLRVIEKARVEGCSRLIGTSRYTRPHVHAWYLKIGFTDWGKEFRIDFDD